MKTNENKLAFSSPFVISLLLALVLGLSPLTILANIQDESGEKGPVTEGHLVYFPIPPDISKEEFLSPSEPLKSRLLSLVEKHLVETQDQSLKDVRDLVVIFTDHDGHPILPDRDALQNKISELGGLLDFAEAENKLTFTFNSPQYPWSAENLSKLQTMLTDFYQTAVIVYGYPAFNITVNVRQNPSASASGLYYSSLNEMVIKTDDSWDIMLFSDVVCHEMIHAFRDDFMISLNSYEEGMTRAAEIEVFDRLSAYFQTFENHAYEFDVYYEELNSPVIGSLFGSFWVTSPNTFILLRYQLAGYAWAKPLLENSTFLSEFNGAYYAKALSDETTSWTESKLLDILVNVQPTVEGKSFLTWYKEQGVLNTDPPKGYFLHHRPGFTVDFFYRDWSGTETMQPNATVQWAVYDFQDQLLDSGSDVTSSYGWISFIPLLPTDYEGRIKVEATASSPEGVITHAYYTVASGSQLKKEGIFGVTPYSESGTVTITWLDDPSLSMSVDLVNGAFSAPNFVGLRGRFKADFRDSSGETFSKQFNKDASSYFLLMVSPPVNLYTLTATKTGTGSGTITGTGIACGTNCTEIYPYGTSVILTASPSTGSTFTSWSGCDSVNNNACTVTITSDKGITASFFLEYTLAVTLEGTGDGRVTSTPTGIDCEPTCSGTFVVGTPIQLSAKPYGGSVFAYWSGACTGTTDTCDLTMTDYIGVTAHFMSEDTKEYTLKVKKTKKNKGDGVVTSNDGKIGCGSACSSSYYKDTVITLSAEANEGSTFIGWKPESPTCTGTGPCITTIDKAKTVQAVFVGDYTLKVTAQSKKKGTGLVSSTPSGISCSPGSKAGCAATYPYAEQLVLSASADTGTTFLGWKPANLCPGTGVCIVPMDKKWSVKAIFSGQ